MTSASLSEPLGEKSLGQFVLGLNGDDSQVSCPLVPSFRTKLNRGSRDEQVQLFPVGKAPWRGSTDFESRDPTVASHSAGQLKVTVVPLANPAP